MYVVKDFTKYVSRLGYKDKDDIVELVSYILDKGEMFGIFLLLLDSDEYEPNEVIASHTDIHIGTVCDDYSRVVLFHNMQKKMDFLGVNEIYCSYMSTEPKILSVPYYTISQLEARLEGEV